MSRFIVTLFAIVFVGAAIWSIASGRPAWNITIRIVIALLFSAQAVMLWRHSSA